MAARDMADRISHGHDAQTERQRHADQPDPHLREGRGYHCAAASGKGEPKGANELGRVFFAVHLMSPFRWSDQPPDAPQLRRKLALLSKADGYCEGVNSNRRIRHAMSASCLARVARASPVRSRSSTPVAFVNHRSLACIRCKLSLHRKANRCAVQTIETAELTEARRCRFAQFRGMPATLQVGGVTVRGLVRSVRELRTSPTPRWVVTIIPR